MALTATSMTLRGRVRGGRLQLDEPLDLPEDTEVNLAVLVDSDDDLSPEELARLRQSIQTSRAQMAAGQTFPIESILTDL